jgi:hypothetical protein
VTAGRDQAVAVLLVAAAAGLVLAHRPFQLVETAPARLVTGDHSAGTAVACSSAYMIVFLLLLASVLIALLPRITPKVLAALGHAAPALVAVDQVRVLSSDLLPTSLLGFVGATTALTLFARHLARPRYPRLQP